MAPLQLIVRVIRSKKKKWKIKNCREKCDSLFTYIENGADYGKENGRMMVIPAYRPGEGWKQMLRGLEGQTWPVHRLIVMNTERKTGKQL